MNAVCPCGVFFLWASSTAEGGVSLHAFATDGCGYQRSEKGRLLPAHARLSLPAASPRCCCALSAGGPPPRARPLSPFAPLRPRGWPASPPPSASGCSLIWAMMSLWCGVSTCALCVGPRNGTEFRGGGVDRARFRGAGLSEGRTLATNVCAKTSLRPFCRPAFTSR